LKRLKEVETRLANHPRVDNEAAKRFVKSGLWQPKKKRGREGEPANKRRK